MKTMYSIRKLLQEQRMVFLRISFILITCINIIGCSTQLYTNIEHNVHLLQKDELKLNGLTFITPTTITGMEEDKQYLALTFSHELKKKRPELKIADLSYALGAINKSNYSIDYAQMYSGYRSTGIFNKKTLKRIGEITDNRYICQLKLSHFKSEAQGRLGFLGLALFDTEKANLRLFVQIWDSHLGIIVWEAAQEITYAYDTSSEDAVTFERMIRLAADEIAKVLP